MSGDRWEDEKARFRDHLGRWAAVAESTRTVIAVKPHRSHACSRPEDAVWLVEQVGSPWIKLVYDYSHFIDRDIALSDSLAAMLPHTAQITVKDAELRRGAASFALPGTTGRIDYVALLRQASSGGYRGDVCCEVSSQLHSRPGYDAEAAARTCYATMALAFREAGIARKRRKDHHMPKVLMPIGDATEMMDTLYPFFRLPEDGFEMVVAGPEGAVVQRSRARDPTQRGRAVGHYAGAAFVPHSSDGGIPRCEAGGFRRPVPLGRPCAGVPPLRQGSAPHHTALRGEEQADRRRVPRD